MNMFSRERIEAFAFMGIHSFATGHVAGEVASMVKSPIAKAVVIGTTMAANAFIYIWIFKNTHQNNRG